MHGRHLLTAAALLLTTSTEATAQARPPAEARVPDLTASTGLVRVPSAYVQSDGSVSIFGAAVPHTASGGTVVGIANRVEIGAASRDIDGDRNRAVGAAKVNLLPEQLLSPAVSVGIVEPFDSHGERHSDYVVVSKTLIPYFVEAATGRGHIALKLHAGYGDGFFRRTAFGGVEVIGDGGVSLIAEVAGGHGSAGLRYVHDRWSATAGMLDTKNRAGVISYTLGLR